MPNKKKRTTPKRFAKKTTRKKSAKKTTPKRKARKRARASKRTTAKRKPRRIEAASKRSSLARKMKFSAKRKKVTSTGLVMETAPLSSVERPHRDGQAGDLQGLSSRPTANLESVEELLDEGKALEAEAVRGVETALDADQGEVEHELPEDDPPEYLDKDR
jgi:hypothetical protein